MKLDELRYLQYLFEVNQRSSLQKHIKELEQTRRKFVNQFSLSRIRKMTKEEYVVGKRINDDTDRNTFCYWVERRTAALGKIQGAPSIKFGIFMCPRTKKYRTLKKFKGDIDTAFSFYKKEIIKLIQAAKNKNLDAIEKIQLSPMFKGKILFLYYPRKFVNIFSERHVDHFLRKAGLLGGTTILDLVRKRDILLNWKNNDPLMIDWSVFEFTHFLYNWIGGPTQKDKIPREIQAYSVEYPDPKIVKADTIPLEIDTSYESVDITTKGTPQKKSDYDKKEAIRKRLGDRGELIVLEEEKQILREGNLPDLAKMVELVSEKDDSAGYDILSYELRDGKKKYIEVKSTTGTTSDPIVINLTSNEYQKGKELENYYIYVVFEVNTNCPKIWPIREPFKYESKGLILIPDRYRVYVKIKSDSSYVRKTHRKKPHSVL